MTLGRVSLTYAPLALVRLTFSFSRSLRTTIICKVGIRGLYYAEFACYFPKVVTAFCGVCWTNPRVGSTAGWQFIPTADRKERGVPACLQTAPPNEGKRTRPPELRCLLHLLARPPKAAERATTELLPDRSSLCSLNFPLIRHG